MPITTLSPFDEAPLLLTADRSERGFARAHRLQSTHVVACTLGLLLLVPVTPFALELGEASIKSGLGQPLLVEIPYRLAANEQLSPACVGLVPAANAADILPTYTRVSRISISSTHIEIFDDNTVRDLRGRVPLGAEKRFFGEDYERYRDLLRRRGPIDGLARLGAD